MKMMSLLNPAVASVFAKTLHYHLRLGNKTESERIVMKKDWGLMVLKSFGFKLQIIGNPPTGISCILVGNHISFLDIPVLLAAAPEVIFIAKDDLIKWPVIGAGAKALGTIFVNRGSGSDRSHVRSQVAKVLHEKKSVVAIFPSGTTCLHEEKPWKKGAFEIAKEANVPIQLFRLNYFPLRESAYIDDDNLLDQMAKVVKFKNKTVTLTWLEQFAPSNNAAAMAHELKEKVISTQF